MPKTYFLLTAILYWGCFLLRAPLRGKESGKWDRIASIAERISLLAFTGSLVFYIMRLQIIDGKVHSAGYDRPVSFLLFAWAICAAHLGTEIVYGNRATAVFAHLWTALTLTISSATTSLFKGIFTDDLGWLSFHRLCFLVGYAFCILAFPLVSRFLWLQFRAGKQPPEMKAETERNLWKLDRMGYRMVLWALPLLTAGIIAEGLMLADNHMLPGPIELWTQQRETLLALVTWFICGIYLHTRLFFGWRYARSAALYLIGLGLVLIGHFSQSFPFGS
ncbi:MAG: cytochrome c biogenesis protein CcsA [Bdellovibrionota bacterium]